MSKLGLTADEVLTTTRAVRKRLDFSRPVEMRDMGNRSHPLTGSERRFNTPRFTFIVVTDADKRVALVELYRKFWSEHSAPPPRPGEAVNKGYARIASSKDYGS